MALRIHFVTPFISVSQILKVLSLLLKREGSLFSKEPEFVNQRSKFIPELFEEISEYLELFRKVFLPQVF